MSYVELNCKSNFSFLRGASDSREYVRRAAELQMTAVGICDVNGVYALPRAFETIRDEAPHLKLISGSEVTVDEHAPITLIAQTRQAYGLMCRILTQVHAGKKGEGSIALSELTHLLENFPGRGELICLPKMDPHTNYALLKELFPHNTYLPLCRYLDGLDRERTLAAKKLSETYGLPLVAHNDVHYHSCTRRPLQDCLTCIREGTTIDKAGFLLFGNEERYLKSPLQMRSLFYDLPEAIRATVEIAEKCTFVLSELKYTYPHEFIPPGHTARSYLQEVVLKGAHEVYKGLIPEKVDAQIRRELDFFAKRGDEHYFLTVHDIVRFAKEQNIICQGRGSAANSIVCYVLGITSVDPVQMNLLFDRFMNEGRPEPPDIDVDFEHDRREEVIQYIYRRFGRDRAAMVSAVRTYRSKSAILEISKALGVNVGTMTAAELVDRFDERAGEEKKYRRAFVNELTSQLQTFPRHLSIHSGGFVLSNDPLVEMVPIEPARMEGRTIVQWDKEDLETLGLMKIDVLSIGFLTVLHKATDLAGLNWRDIPDNDAKTYRMIQRAETHGTFQIESRAQMNMLVQTLPQNYYDLVIEVALVRPSPTVGGMVHPFLRGLKESRKGRPFRSESKELERILGRTHGIPIFQEQIMEISIAIGGFTPSEADQLRRSLVRQRSAAALDAMGKKLYNALVNAGIPHAFADSLFLFIQGYAHYGFPESHAASYASLAYKSAYLKCHHPAELLIGLINSQPMGFYSIDNLMHEAERNSGVKMLPIDPHLSIWDATLEAPKTVRMGFRNVKSIREPDVLAMISEREQRPFANIEDFIFRTTFSEDVIENLSMAGVFDPFGLDRRHTFWKSLEFAALCDKKVSTQLSLFNEDTCIENPVGLFGQMSLLEQVTMDHQMTGYSLEGSLMKAIRLEAPHLPPITSRKIKSLPAGRLIRYAGIVGVLQRPPPAKGTAFITFEDEHGTVDSVVRNEVYEKYRDIIRASRFLIVEGKIQRRGTAASILITHIESFATGRSKRRHHPGPHPRALGPLEY